MNRLIYLVVFLPFGVTAQTDEHTDLNARFDQAILNDTFYKISRVADFPESEPVQKPPALWYSIGYNSWDVPGILDNPAYTEAEKIAFLEDALADKSRDALAGIYNYKIGFWHTSKQGKALANRYFQQFEHSENTWDRFMYFRFRTINSFPETYPLILDYFKNRDTMTTKYFAETDLIYRLILLNKEKEALAFLNILLNEFMTGKAEEHVLTVGGDPAYNGHVMFDLLCFSSDPVVAKESTEMLFTFLESGNFHHMELYALAAYLDQERHFRLLRKKFTYYSKIDFSKIDYAALNATKSDNTWNNLTESYPEARSYVAFMSSANAPFLGPAIGKALWTNFIKNLSLWELYDHFTSNQLYLLEQAFQDKTLSVKEKRQMLFQVKGIEKLFSGADNDGTYRPRLLQLICAAYPDKQMTREDFNRLHLGEFLEYTSPLLIRPDELEVHIFRTNLQGGKIDEVVGEINKFAQANNLKTMHLDKKERFYLSLEGTEYTVGEFLAKNEKRIEFNSQCSSPPSYANLFQKEFQPLLNRFGINDIEVSQVNENTNAGTRRYDIFVKGKVSIYHYTFSERGANGYDAQRLVKMLNLCLMDEKAPFRLVGVNTHGMFYLIEPAQIKPLLDKLEIMHWAVRYGDVFQAD